MTVRILQGDVFERLRELRGRVVGVQVAQALHDGKPQPQAIVLRARMVGTVKLVEDELLLCHPNAATRVAHFHHQGIVDRFKAQ